MRWLSSLFILLLVPTLCWGAVDLDGGTDYISFADDSDFSVATTNELTVLVWVNPDGVGTTNGMVFTKGAGSNYEWALSVRSTGVIRATISQLNGVDYMAIDSTATVANGTWYLIGFTCDTDPSDSLKTWINGANDAEDTTSSGSLGDGTTAIRLGERGDGADDYNGQVSEAMIFNRVLTEAELLLLSNAKVKGLGLQISGLVFYAPLDDYSAGNGTLDSTSWKDRSGGGNDGTGTDADNDSDTLSETVLSYP